MTLVPTQEKAVALDVRSDVSPYITLSIKYYVARPFGHHFDINFDNQYFDSNYLTTNIFLTTNFCDRRNDILVLHATFFAVVIHLTTVTVLNLLSSGSLFFW